MTPSAVPVLTSTHTPQARPTPTSPQLAATATATAVVETTATPDLRPGMVVGSLCYPSSNPPPMTLYLQNVATGDEIALNVAQGQTSYTSPLPPGEYVAFAHTVGTELAGSYAWAGSCEGESAACAEHRLRSFQVKAGETRENIDLCDWYDPPGISPESDSAGQSAGPVIVTTLQNMNVYTGPGLMYPDFGVAPPRSVAKAVGRTEDSSWLQTEFPALGAAWIYAPLTQVTGRPETLPVAPAGAEAQIPENTNSEGDRSQFVPTEWSASYNESIVHFKGYIRDEAGKPVNGFSVLLDNGTWSVLSHPTGASHHYPEVEDGAWDLVISNAADAAGWWALTVVRYECPDFEKGFNAQCKQFTPLSETQIVRVIYPDENVINADWVCQSDCDQGLYVEAYRRP